MIKTRIWLRRIHKWLGLLIGLQVLLWLSGGVVMSLIPIDMVRGADQVKQDMETLPEQLSGFSVPLSQFSAHGVISARPGLRLGLPVWFLQHSDSSQRVVDATSGVDLPALDETEAADIARGAHADMPAVLAVAQVERADGEIRGARLPLWRVDLDDSWRSRVYVDPITGRIAAVRNDLWRVYDFFWMLHIMDYGAREDFNNNLLRSAAGVGWFIGLTGLWMLFYSFRRSDFGLKRKLGK
jgi:hypothetical protein